MVGWLLKFNGVEFPNRLIAHESLKITPDQIMDLDPYRDANGQLHRNILPHTATTIEFSTPYLSLKDIEILNTFLTKENRVKCNIEYWNPNTSLYASGTFYIADVPYEISRVNEKTSDIIYKPVKVTIIEY